MKTVFRIIRRSQYLSRKFLHLFIRLHHFAYKVLTVLASAAEPDKIHPKHKIIAYYRWFLDQIQPDWTVLDVGCGIGYVAYQVSKKAKEVVAIDKDPRAIAFARRTFHNDNLFYTMADICHYTINIRIDVIILSGVLEHINDRIGTLKRLRGIADVILIRVPLVSRDWLTVYKMQNGLPHLMDNDHCLEYTTDLLIEEAQKAGLEVIKTNIQFGELYAVARRSF